jgi:hypothetical protein
MNQTVTRHWPLLAFFVTVGIAIPILEGSPSRSPEARLLREIGVVFILAFAFLSNYQPPKLFVTALPPWVGRVVAATLLAAVTAVAIAFVVRLRAG